MLEVKVYIDCAEKSEFKLLAMTKLNAIECKMDVGDIKIQINDYTILIERKKINDLASSLTDGRYREQKIRLLSAKNLNTQIIYLIEGNYEDLDKLYHKKFTWDKFRGCIIGTMVRDDISIFMSKNMEDTIEFLRDIIKRLPNYIKEINKKKNLENDMQNISNDSIKYTNSIKLKKKDNITNEVCFINQLAQIPGVSIIIAQTIVNKYKNWINLLEEYNKIEETDTNKKEKIREELMKNIQVGNRKIGPVVSKRIYQYIYGLN